MKTNLEFHLAVLVMGAVCLVGCSSPKEKPETGSTASDTVLAEVLAATNSPLIYNKKVGEYQLVFSTMEDGQEVQKSYVLNYSPFTGTPLPSHRAELFTKPSEAEVRTVLQKLKRVATLTEVEKILGKPDDIYRDEKSFKTQYSYQSGFITFQLFVQETYDGKLIFGYAGKEKKQTKD